MPAQARDLVERMKNSPVSTGPPGTLTGAGAPVQLGTVAVKEPEAPLQLLLQVCLQEGPNDPQEAGLTTKAPSLLHPLTLTLAPRPLGLAAEGRERAESWRSMALASGSFPLYPEPYYVNVGF